MKKGRCDLDDFTKMRPLMTTRPELMTAGAFQMNALVFWPKEHSLRNGLVPDPSEPIGEVMRERAIIE